MAAKYLCSGDRAITVEFGEEISEEVNKKVLAMKQELDRDGVNGIEELVPTYRSLLVYYRPDAIKHGDLVCKLKDIEGRLNMQSLEVKRTLEIPVLYGGEHGPDLERVSRLNGVSEELAVSIHSSKEYPVYMLGFTPGFPYMGGLDQELATPRLETPRGKIPPGSVGIAGDQTGIYPVESPGGWNIIGRTPLRLYDIDRKNPVLIEPGDHIFFKPVDRAEYIKIASEIALKRYKHKFR